MVRLEGVHARAIVIAIAVIGVISVILSDSSIRRWAIDFLEWVHAEGAPAVVVFMAGYIVAVLLLVPRSLLSLAAGFLYGLIWGAVIAIACGFAAALLGFVLARRIGHTWAMQRLRRHPKMAAVERVVDRAGAKVTFLVRLAPFLPYGIVSYGFGLTAIPRREFALGTALGLVPGSVLNAYLGSQVTVVTRVGAHASPLGLWIGVALAVISLVALAVFAHHALAHELREPP